MGKTGCVIQGNVRYGFDEVLAAMKHHFECVVLSTWKSEKSKVPQGKFELILNDHPPNNGISNRNLQRISTIAGLKCAESLGCEYVLKWRTDMLPTSLDCDELLRIVNYKVPADVPSRVMMSAFRNLSIYPDWFSSFPDLYAFGHIDMIKLLWNHGEFDFSLPFNIPPAMLAQEDIELTEDHRLLLQKQDVTDCYNAHAELYAFFKDGLQEYLGRRIEHSEIARDYLYPMNHERLKICWFRADKKLKFRSIGQVSYIPWLTEKAWRRDNLAAPIMLWDYRNLRNNFFQNVYKIIRIRREMLLGRYWWYRY